MKARVKATGKIVDVKWFGHYSTGAIYADDTLTSKYYEHELDFNTVYDYWEKLKHYYAGMAMQGILSNPNHALWERENNANGIAESANNIATALVEKLKAE